jgi:hypothetical protein
MNNYWQFRKIENKPKYIHKFKHAHYYYFTRNVIFTNGLIRICYNSI